MVLPTKLNAQHAYSASTTLGQAKQLAEDHGNPVITPAHVLASLLDDTEGVARRICSKVDEDADLLLSRAMEKVRQKLQA